MDSLCKELQSQIRHLSYENDVLKDKLKAKDTTQVDSFVFQKTQTP